MKTIALRLWALGLALNVLSVTTPNALSQQEVSPRPVKVLVAYSVMLQNRMVVAGPLFQNDKTASVWDELGAAAMTGPLDPGGSKAELDSAQRLGQRVAQVARKMR